MRTDPADHDHMPVSEHPVVACYREPDNADAVQLGALFATALHEPLILCCAYEYEPSALTAVAEPDNERRMIAAHRALDQARHLVGDDIDVRQQALPALHIAQTLASFATQQHACALVVDRDLAGHVTRSLLKRAACPIAVAPLTASLPEPNTLRRIGVAFDGTPAAYEALAAATELALATRTGLELLVIAADAATGRSWLHDAQAAVSAPIDIESHVLRGDPATCLIAASKNLDLLVCGSHGRGRVLAAVLGSVSAPLAAAAHCTVLIVRATDPRTQDSPLELITAPTGS